MKLLSKKIFTARYHVEDFNQSWCHFVEKFLFGNTITNSGMHFTRATDKIHLIHT